MRAALQVASALALILPCGGASFAQERPIVAVFDLEVRGVKLDQEIIARLTDYLGTLLGTRGFQVVPRSQLKERIIEAKKGSYKECYDQSCQIEIGKELAAQKSLASQVLKIGSSCKITLNLFDLKKAASEASGAASGGCTEDEIVTSLEKALETMFGGKAKGAPPPDSSGYEELAARAKAEEARRLEQETRARAERERARTEMEKAWSAVGRIAASEGMTPQARAEVVRKFLQDFRLDNPHEAEARELLARLEAPQVEPARHQGMVRVPAGEFLMGCTDGSSDCYDDEKPPHPVWIEEFWMDAREVTFGDFARCVQAGRCEPPHVDDGTCAIYAGGKWAKGRLADAFRDADRPVVCVDWSQATSFCAWKEKRLPTEAEWEKAARAGTSGARYGALDAIAWYDGNSGGATRSVGKKQPNAFGLHDMLGNAWEWCADWFAARYYTGAPARDEGGPPSGKDRTLRGGSWNRDPRRVRAPNRGHYPPESRFDSVGFRCAASGDSRP